MNHSLVSACWITTVASVVALGLGACRSAPASSEPATAAGGTASEALAPARVERGEGRVHILLAADLTPRVRPHAQQVDTASGDLLEEIRESRLDQVSLGAGDALGRQMFERYASIVRSQMRDDDRELVEADDATEAPSAALARRLSHRSHQ